MVERRPKLTVAVTGGAGQLGTCVLRRLAEHRRVGRIVSIDLAPVRHASGKLTAVTLDVRDPKLGEHFEGCDAVLHLAFVVTKSLPRAESDSINVDGSIRVFEAAAARGVKHVIYASSIAAYGVVAGHEIPIREDAPRVHQERFYYASAKWRVEDWLDRFEPAHPDLVVTRMRPSVLIGAEMEHPLGTALRHRVLPEVASVPLPIVWDEDVADAMVVALDRGAEARGAFNLSSTPALTVSELARAAGMRSVEVPRALLEASAKLAAFDLDWVRSGDVPMEPEVKRAVEVLGWKPSCPTAPEVMRKLDAVAPEMADPRIALFLRAVDLGARSAPRLRDLEHFAKVHLRVTGRAGGDWTIWTGDGRMHVERGAPRPPTSVVTIPAATMLELIGGAREWSRVLLTGGVRIDGEQFAGFLIGGMFAMLREQAERRGVRGRVARAMRRVLGKGASK